MTAHQHISQQVVELRGALHWSQGDLAARAGIDQGHLSGMEGCKRKWSVDALVAVAAAFGVKLDRLADIEAIRDTEAA